MKKRLCKERTGLVFFPAFDWAISPTHPEREERLLYTRDQLFEEGIMDLPQILQLEPRLAEIKDIARVHFCVPDIEFQATKAHLIAAGSAIAIADSLMKGEIKNGFALVRPPGHHAMRVVHGNRGFCNINNEAVMVEHLRKVYGIKRLAIIDTDVHHGDGTQDIYWHDPDVLFISFHQDGRTLFPGSGFMDELGGPLAFGTTLNIPLPPGTTDEGILFVLDKLVLPVLDIFQPELVINSAGQDNHYKDPLANMNFSTQGYATLNKKLAPDIAVLEGGYSIETALPYINMGIIMAMAGIDYSNLYEPDYYKYSFKEDSKRLKILETMVEQLFEVFNKREVIQANNREKAGAFYERQRHIFYDTDGINEKQLETVKVCPSCPGYITIDSQASHGRSKNSKIYCIVIPIQACSDCQEKAREKYEKKLMDNSGDFQYIYLQDRVADNYRQYDCRKQKEIVL
ncbi:MAG: histone deacetylase [Peptococcaceae bacterium BICA1-8]|nr:MAG: histone deacetylase [Peptococcaceae bacterium BICA1-8]